MAKDLSYAAVDVQPVDFDWSEGYGEKWDIVLPDVDNWDLRKCSAFLEDEGYSGNPPEPNPFAPQGYNALCRLACDLEVEGFEYDHDEDGDLVDAEDGAPAFFLPYDISSMDEGPERDEAVREAIIEAIDDEEIDGIDEWRDAVRPIIDDDRDRYEPVMNYYYPLPGLKYRGFTPESAQDAIEDTPCVVVLVDDEPVLALAGGGMDCSPGICQAYLKLGYYPPLHFASGLPRLGKGYSWMSRDLVEAAAESARVAELEARNARERLEEFAKEFAEAPAHP